MPLPLIAKALIAYGVIKFLGSRDEDEDEDEDKPKRAGKSDGDDDSEDSGDSSSDPPGHELDDGDPVEGQTAQGAKAMRQDGRMLVACRATANAPLIWWEAKPGNPCCKAASGSTFTYGSGQIVCALDDFTNRYTWKDVPK